MLTVNGADVRRFSLAAKQSLWFLSIFAILLACALFVERAYFQAGMEAVNAAEKSADRARETIVLADEKLTMSALAYAGTADEAMRARYEANLPVIDNAIADVKTMVSPAIAARFDRETRVANDRLVHMESLAFALAKRGDTQGARAIFNSPPYKANKAMLADGSDKMLGELYLDLKAHSDTLAETRRLALLLMSALAVIAFTVLVWRVKTALEKSQSAFFSAMTEMETSEKSAIKAARHDSLVGLPNRVFLCEALTHNLRVAQNVTLLYLDLDGFKTVNDTYGHDTGDSLLRILSAEIGDIVGKHGLLARLGGDEFAIMLASADAADKAEAISDAIHKLFQTQFDIDGRMANVGVSIGIATADDHARDAIELMRRADVAMYDAKNNGRNLKRHFNVELDLKHREDLMIAAEMRDFVANRQFEVAYQPIVDSRTAAIMGIEVLARWPAASARTLEPSHFIKIAEEQGIIDDLGALVFDIACRDVAPIKGLRLAINVSPLQLNHPSFIDGFVETAARHDFALSRLEIELTENVLIRYPDRAKKIIADLQALGITVSLDDFGTGFASVGYLREFGFNAVKLDRSLTQAIATDPSAQLVAQGTVMIANGLSATTVAEGVETIAEADIMRLLGCQKLQGFLFGRPAPIATYEGFSESSSRGSRAA
jgi:diguanylate cyclase (GGDEF)-like protein